jgi:membrane protein
MKNIASKKTTQKIFLIVLTVLLFSCIVPNYSMALRPSDNGTDTHSYNPVKIDSEITVEDVSFDGGTLLTPIKKLCYTVGDAIMTIAQKIVIGNKFTVPCANVTPVGDKGTGEGHDAWDDAGDNNIKYPAYLYLTPESIFRNQIASLNPNFINAINMDGTLEKALGGDDDVVMDGKTSTSHADNVEKNLNVLRSTIAKWYVAIRNFSLVGLLSVLVYIGIRVVISSTASDKAKYKQMISSWVGAICLIFLLHYIMAFTFTLTENLTDLFNSNMGNPGIKLPSVVGDDAKFTFNDKTNNEKFSEVLSKLQGEHLVIKGNVFNANNEITGVANLMQYARLYANLNGASGLGYTITYLFLVGFTVIYFAKYIGRFIRIAFLTLIAPLITLTYPIDKLNDGQAQAFNMWLKEFTFNVLIQPFHLLIYMIFISSALEFANSNIIYTIVVLGFMTQAEKLLRKMFGFEKASTMGAFSGAAAGSMLANVAGKIGNKVAKGKGGSGGNGGSGGSGDGASQPDRIRAKEDPYDGLNPRDGNGQSQQNNNEPIQNSGNNFNNNDLDEEGKTIESERAALDSLLDEGTTPGADWSDDDYKAYQELEKEQEEQEQNTIPMQEQNSELEAEDSNDLTKGQMVGNAVKAVARNKAMRLGNKTGSHYINAWKATKGMGGKARAKALGKEAWNGAKVAAPKALKLGARTAGRYTFAGTAALISGSAALMSGDPSKIASAVGIAATAGSKTGRVVADKGISRVSKDWNIAKRGYYGKDYAAKQEAALNDKWKNDAEIDDKYREAFGNENFKAAKEAALEMRENYGTTDDDQIIKSLKMTSEFGGEKAAKEATKANTEVPTLELAKRIPAFAKGISDDMYDDYDRYNTGRNKMIDKFTRQPGYDLKKAEQTTDTILKQVARVKGKEIPVQKAIPQSKPKGRTNKK